MKLLPEPYGYGEGTHISLRTEGCVGPTFVAVLQQYSCYAPAIPKITQCLASSGRYDCVVRRSWFKQQQRELGAALLAIGVELVLL